ncbi:MAG: hypothetical protein V4683_13495 [Bacteroidota bacterium]
MAAVIQNLNPIQVHLLKFFSEKNINESETKELQLLIANYYSQKADNLMNKIWDEKGFSDKKINELLEKDFDK